jgi:hypothetical protein
VDRLHEPVQAAGGGLHPDCHLLWLVAPLAGGDSPLLRTTLPRSDTDSRLSFEDFLAPTPVEALAGLADVVRDVLTDLAASGEPIPEPLSERTYSGRFVVRVPAEVHRRLAREAAEQHVSLNRLVSDRLARA